MAGYADDFGSEFQSHILATMCRVPGFVLRFRTALDHKYFVDDANRVIAQCLLAHSDKYHVLPQQSTLVEEVRPRVGKDDFAVVDSRIEDLYFEDVSDSVAVMEKAVEFGKQQALVNAVISAGDRLDKGDRIIRPLIDEALTVGEDLLNVGIHYVPELEDRLKWYTDPESATPRLRTGITHMDQVLTGGLARGELGVILAPPKKGKTTTLVNVGFGALTDVAGLTVFHYSLEMGEKNVVQRYDDRLMGPRVKYKRSDPKRYVQELTDRANKLIPGRLVVKSYPTRSATPSTLRSHISLMIAQGLHPDVLIVDYAAILKPERRIGEMRHEHAGLYEDMRTIAGEFNCAVWTGAQAKASSWQSETVTMSDFAEASELAAIVDAVFALCQTDDERIEAKARLFAAGLRFAEDGYTVEVDIRRDCCFIRSTGVLSSAGTRIGESGGGQESTKKIDAVKVKVGLKKKKRKVGPVKSAGPTKKKKTSKKRMLQPRKELNFGD